MLLVCGCGEVPMQTRPDASSTVDSNGQPTSDAPDGSSQLGPWSTPSLIGALSTTFTEGHPTIRADGCEIFFNSNRDGNNTDIWTSSRFTVNDPWSTPRLVTELDATSTTETGPDLSDDGKTIYFARAIVGGSTGYDLYMATRNSPSEPWGQVSLVTELNTTGNERSPHMSSDGKTIWYAHYNGTDYDIWTATRSTPTGVWTNPHEVPRFTSTSEDEGPTTTGDGLTFFFDSTSSGSQMVYTSTRDPGNPWSLPTPVTELAGAHWVDVTPDGRYMVMTIDSGTGFDLYESRR